MLARVPRLDNNNNDYRASNKRNYRRPNNRLVNHFTRTRKKNRRSKVETLIALKPPAQTSEACRWRKLGRTDHLTTLSEGLDSTKLKTWLSIAGYPVMKERDVETLPMDDSPRTLVVRIQRHWSVRTSIVMKQRLHLYSTITTKIHLCTARQPVYIPDVDADMNIAVCTYSANGARRRKPCKPSTY